MFSEKTKDLAKQLRRIQEQLSDSIRADLAAVNLDGDLCTHSREQMWFDRDQENYTAIKNALPVDYAERHGDAEHVYFMVGEVPFVTVFIKAKE